MSKLPKIRQRAHKREDRNNQVDAKVIIDERKSMRYLKTNE